MDTVTSLRAAVGLLTRPSKHCLKDPDGGPVRWVTADPLLVQLAQAVRSSSPGGSYTTSGGTPSLISAAALDLQAEIGAVTDEHWWALYSSHHGHGRSAGTAVKLRTWAAVAELDADKAREAERICTGWVRSITDLLYPVRRVEIRGPCPECGTERVLDRLDEEGGRIMKPALMVTYHRENGRPCPECGACGAVWADMQELRDQMDGATR